MVYADTANNMFFARYPHIKEIKAYASAGSVTQFYLAFDTAGAGEVYGEFYDLLFEGDAYMYKQKYPPVHFKIPSFTAEYIHGDPSPGKTSKGVGTTIYKDSVVYYGSERRQLIEERDYGLPSGGMGWPPKYLGDLQKVAGTIEQEYKAHHPMAGADTVLVYRGLVDKAGYMRKLELISGTPTPFSDFVKGHLARAFLTEDLDKRPRWKPGVVASSGISNRAKTKIYVHRDRDGRFTVLTPRVLTSAYWD